MLEWLSSLGTIRGTTYPLVTDGGVSAETFRYVVGAFVAALGTTLGIIRQMYEKRDREKDAKIAELEKRLDAYGAVAPDIVAQVRKMLAESPTPPPSPPSTVLPFPYERSRPTRRRRRPTGDQP